MNCPRCKKYGGHGWVTRQFYYVKNYTDSENGAVEGLHCVICGWCVTRPWRRWSMGREATWAELRGKWEKVKCKVVGCHILVGVRKDGRGLCPVHAKKLNNYKYKHRNKPPEKRPPEPFIETPKGWVLNTARNREKWKKENTAEPVTTRAGKD